MLSLTTSADLRKSILQTIVNDIRHANRSSKNPRLNRMVQGLLFGMVSRGMPGSDGEAPVVLKRADAELRGRAEALWAVRLAAEMWRRRVWTDERTVALLALACIHPHPKVQASAVRFFLGDLHAAEAGAAGSDDEDSDAPAEVPDVGRLQHQRKVGRKSRSTEKRVKAAQALARRRRKENAQRALDRQDRETGNMAALHLLHDPQTFAEQLFENLSRGDKRHSLEIKVRLMQLISRVMGTHRLCVLSFYSYMSRYLQPHQLHITLILVSLAQSVHDQTPSDVLTPTLRKIAYSFVHPGVGAEVVAAGINTIREICRRQPWCMETDLLEDLVTYRKSKDKGVSAASRGLMQLYREVNPGMLRRTERGKAGTQALAQGQALRPQGADMRSVHGIQGIELLEQHLGERGENEADGEDDEEAWKDWEVESTSDSDSSGGWINVSDDDDNASHFSLDRSDVDDSDEEAQRKAAANDGMRPSERVREARRRRREERAAKRDQDEEEEEEAPPPPQPAEEKISELATTRILTPADFAKLNELRLAQAEERSKGGGAAGAAARRELAALQLAKKRMATGETPELVEEGDILGPRKKPKADHEERVRSIEQGREGREKFGSKKGKKNKEVPSSSTNRQKARSKNFQMVAKSWGVRSKKNASLREKSKRLRQHAAQSKKKKK